MMNINKLIYFGRYSFIKFEQKIILIFIIPLIKVIFGSNKNIDLQTEYNSYPEQQVMIGSGVSLPCDISAPGISSTDSVTLILWYKGQDISGAPIYSIDARSRNTPLESAKHFVGEEYEGRANFDITVRPAILKIYPINDADGGHYWCRVDFRWTRTTISKVPLIVIVPPKRVIIRNENGIELKNIGLFDEGSDVQLLCESIGGNPTPTITWYHNSRKLKTQTVMIRDNNTVVSSIILERIQRNDLNSVIRCHAMNNELDKSLVKSITIDINLRPLKTEIFGLNRDHLTAGRRIEAICHTYGSRPPAVINWFINDRKLADSKDMQIEGNGTKSVVSFIPMPEDNGLNLICRAENLRLPNIMAEDKIKLDVKCIILTLAHEDASPSSQRYHIEIGVTRIIIAIMPNVTLKIGVLTEMTIVNESSEVVLDCKVSSNPKATHIRWLFNRKELIQDIAKGIIITNSSLIVKNIRQESEGRYQCVAYNSEGRGDSTELFVQVFFAPKCVSQQRVIETSIMFPTNIFCQVNANPENVTFVWESANIEDRRRITISSKSLRSKLSLIPQTWNDFGLYTCWAYNSVGSNQMNPCVFNVTDSGQSLPKPVTDCRVNTTHNSVYIKCLYPLTSSPQIFKKETNFHLEVRDSHKNRLIVNLTNSEQPVFNVTDIEWSPFYQLIIYVSNSYGTSNEVTMMVQTELPALKSLVKASPISPNSQQQTNDMNSSHKILVILISLLTVVLIILSILITITIVLCFLRQQNNRKRNKRDCSEPKESGLSLQSTRNKKKYKNKKLSQTNIKTSDDSIATSDGSVHPDVIPCDGVVFYNNDHNIIDDNSCDNRFNANNSLSIYKDIIISSAASDQHNQQRIVNKNILTNHTNHVSVINERQNTNICENLVLIQTHHNQPLGTLITKLQNFDTSSNIEANECYRLINSSYPQTTPV